MNKIATILLLIASNVFMTYAWHGHLKDMKGRALMLVVLISWSIAFFEYLRIRLGKRGKTFI